MPIRANTCRAVVACLSTLLPGGACAESIDTEYLFGFMIGTDVGNVGERELQTQISGRFARNGGTYRAVGQDFEVEFVPVKNVRVELGTTFSSHWIQGAPGFEDRRKSSWEGASVDLRYRFLERDEAPFGFTFAIESHASRVDETTAEKVRRYGTEFTAAFDRELVPNVVVAALNLTYQPEWTRAIGTRAAEQESSLGTALGLMVQWRPGFLLGGEARYLRRYEGIGLQELAGQALFVGPTAYFQLSRRARLTAAWSMQAWGRPTGSNRSLDLVNFERHQARLIFGVNF